MQWRSSRRSAWRSDELGVRPAPVDRRAPRPAFRRSTRVPILLPRSRRESPAEEPRTCRGRAVRVLAGATRVVPGLPRGLRRIVDGGDRARVRARIALRRVVDRDAPRAAARRLEPAVPVSCAARLALVLWLPLAPAPRRGPPR